MIISGGARANSGFYAWHLGRTDTNERMQVIETRGLVAGDIEGAFQEMAGVASGTRCRNFFYVVSVNPREEEHLTPEQWQDGIDRIERRLGLDGQSRLVVEHEKEGRTHRHVVWSRINLDTMTAISDSFNFQKHEQASRELEELFGLEPVESVLTKDREKERPERRPADWESFRGESTGINPREMKAQITALWQEADSGIAFKAALEEAGYILARGDRRDFCIVDSAGDEHSLARRIAGAKAADIRARMSDVDRTELPSVAEARELVRNARDARSTATEGMEPEPVSEAPMGTPADWQEAPTGSVSDRQEMPSAGQSGVAMPQGTAQAWQAAPSGQGSDQREEHTAWERFAGRARGYWERFVAFVRHDGGATKDAGEPGAEAEPQAGFWQTMVKARRTLNSLLRNERGSVPGGDDELSEEQTPEVSSAGSEISPSAFERMAADYQAELAAEDEAEPPDPDAAFTPEIDEQEAPEPGNPEPDGPDMDD